MLTTLALTLMLSPAMAQQQQSADMLNDSDQAFLRKVAEINLAEVSASKLVMDKTDDDSIKAACQKMIDDHTKSMDQLKAVALTYQYNLPVNPTESAKTDYKRLDNEMGGDLNKDFVSVQFEGHRKALHIFRDEMKNGSAGGVKRFDDMTLPTIKSHYKLWRALALKFGVISTDYRDDDDILSMDKDGGR